MKPTCLLVHVAKLFDHADCIVISVIGLISYGSFVYLPRFVVACSVFVYRLFVGDSEPIATA